MSKSILGINFYAHDSSAALVRDGEVVFAASEERFSRVKKDRGFPARSIRAALDYAGLEFRELDAVAFGWNRPGTSPLHTLRSALSGRINASGLYTLGSAYAIPGELARGSGLQLLNWHFGGVERSRVYYIDHHEAHAWSAYALSGFDDALVLVVDGRGARQATSIYHGRNGKLDLLRIYPWPNSLGTFYESFTDLLGFERHNDEWKVMGLAAYGEANVPLDDWIRVTEHGYEVDGMRLCGSNPADISHLTKSFGPRRDPERQITDEDRNLAASVQQATEEAIFSLVREGMRLTGSRDVCLAGGVALNSKANGRLLASGLIDRIFIQPAAADEGTAIGAPLGVYAARGETVPRCEMRDAYLGPAFTDSAIEAALQAYKLPVVYVPDAPALAAHLLAEGNIVGWFQGRMEFGPRALGNRSILADARRPEMKDRVNDSVKFREGWRPFAPSCLAEAADEYFDGCRDAPFMILTFDVRPEKRAIIPAVTHADNTARVQTVERDVNPAYWRLIDQFARLTGVPVIMNTSFNLRGEPIVCTPKDAIRTFYSSGLDFLVLGDFVVPKDRSWTPGGEAEARQAVGAGVWADRV